MGKAFVKAEQNGGVIVLESIPKMNCQTKPYFDPCTTVSFVTGYCAYIKDINNIVIIVLLVIFLGQLILWEDII